MVSFVVFFLVGAFVLYFVQYMMAQQVAKQNRAEPPDENARLLCKNLRLAGWKEPMISQYCAECTIQYFGPELPQHSALDYEEVRVK